MKKITSRQYLTTTLAAVAFIHAGASCAQDTGLYAGRTLPSGVPVTPSKDQAQLALEPGSAALGADSARLEGERVFGGYRFGPGFALEGARTRTSPSVLAPSSETISVAGVGSVPLSDSVTLVSRLGLSYQPSTFAGNGVSLADVSSSSRLYGVGLSVRVRNNVEVHAQTEHLARTANPALGPPASDSVLFGANVHF